MKITMERCRQIFGNPGLPGEIHEHQFDDFNAELQQMARKRPEDITLDDLSYYVHDLAYVDLQKDLFEYLFPVCLFHWYQALMRNESCEWGPEFHYAVHEGHLLERMVTASQREAICQLFHDGLIERIEAERGSVYRGSGTPAYAWMYRFNSLGLIAPVIERIWQTWWTLDSPGKAVSAIMYASGLMYLKHDNPIFAAWTPDRGGGGPWLAGSDSHVFADGWRVENLEFMTRTLRYSYIRAKVEHAANVLKGEPEAALAARVAADSASHEEIVNLRIGNLLNQLKNPNEWSFSKELM
jgi:hypothetical protein